MGRIIGIDLGTSYSVAAFAEGRAGEGFLAVDECPGCAVILDRQGRPGTPSVIGEDQNGNIVVGYQAKARIGTTAPVIQFAIQHLGEDKTFQLSKHGDLRPEEVVAHILRHLKQLAEERLEETVDKAAIAVPGFLSLRARQLIVEAARRAGFHIARIVDTASAISLAYFANDARDSLRVMTFDLGGGKFECAVVEKRREILTASATVGDRFLGGRDFDESLAWWMVDKLNAQGYDLRLNLDDPADKLIFEKLTTYAERAKINLSTRQSCEIEDFATGLTDHTGAPLDIELSITREEFESLIAKDVERVVELCHRLLEDEIGSLSRREPVDEILMVGGSSRIPLVAQRLEEQLGIKPKLFEPDLIVALGAARAASLSEATGSEAEIPPLRVGSSNVLSRSIDIWLEHGKFVLAPEGTTLPFCTSFDARISSETRELRLPLIEGDERLCDLTLTGFPENIPGGSAVKVTVFIDEDYQIRGESAVLGQALAMSTEYSISENSPVLEPPRSEFEREFVELRDLLRHLDERDSELAREDYERQLEAVRFEAEQAYKFQDSVALKEAVSRMSDVHDRVMAAAYQKNPDLLLRLIDRQLEQLKYDKGRGSDEGFGAMSAKGGGAGFSGSSAIRGEQLTRLRERVAAAERERLLAKANEAAERNNWDAAINALRSGLTESRGTEDQDSLRQNLSGCLANRAVSNLNSITEALQSATSANRTEILDAVRSAERDLEEAVRLDPSSRNAAKNLDELRKVFARRGTPKVPGNKLDRVYFSVTSPPSVLAGHSFVIDVWAHLEREREKVIQRAREAIGGGEISIKSKGPAKIARGTVLTVRLKVDDLSIEEPEDVILWEGEAGNATFIVTAPIGIAEGAKRGLATIHVDGLRIAKVDFIVQVGAKSEPVELAAQQQLHRTAFVSYASPDRERVLPRVQGIQKAAKGLEVFMDMLSLHSGQYWEQELWRVIPSSDVFYLFWSKNAKESEWVEKEWRCALETRGIDFIDPVPLDSPDEVKPPPELSGKHFNDWVLAFMSSKHSGHI